MSTVNPSHEPWPVWARVMIAVLLILVVATVVPWIFMGVAMAAGCSGMMGGSPMPSPMMR